MCSDRDEMRAALDRVLLHPKGSAPAGFEKVSDGPLSYARLVAVRCAFLGPSHEVVTASGLKRIRNVEIDF